MNNMKRLLSLVLAMALVLGCVPVQALALEAEENPTSLLDTLKSAHTQGENLQEALVKALSPTTEPTTAPTEASAEATTAPTEASTEATTAPTEAPTEATTAPTEASAEATTAPTEAPAEATTDPTEAPAATVLDLGSVKNDVANTSVGAAPTPKTVKLEDLLAAAEKWENGDKSTNPASLMIDVSDESGWPEGSVFTFIPVNQDDPFGVSNVTLAQYWDEYGDRYTAGGTYTIKWYRRSGASGYGDGITIHDQGTIDVKIDGPVANYYTKKNTDSMDYTGESQTLMSATAKHGTVMYAVSTTDYTNPPQRWTTTPPTATDAGTYYVWYKVAGTEQYQGIDAQCAWISINKARTNEITGKTTAGFYTGEYQNLLTCTSTFGTVEYALGGLLDNNAPTDGWSTTPPTGLVPTWYYVWYRVVGTDNYVGIEPTKEEVWMLPALNEFEDEPSTTLIYTGNEQTLLTRTASWGTVQYALGTDAATAPDSGWSTTAPKATAEGTYYVWCKVEKGDYYLGIEPVCTTVTIVNKDASVTAVPTAVTGLVYKGSAHTLITAGTAKNGTMQYKVNSGEWSTELPVAADAGEYTVYYKAVATEGGRDSAESSLKVSIAKADPAVTVTSNTLTYTGAGQALVTVATNDVVSVCFALGDNADTAPDSINSSATPTGINAGTYYVWYKVVGGDNYNDVSPRCVTVTINKLVVTPSAEAKTGLVYKGDPQALYTVTVTDNNEKAVSSDWYKVTYADMSGASENGMATDAGTYTNTVTVELLNENVVLSGNAESWTQDVSATIAKAKQADLTIDAIEIAYGDKVTLSTTGGSGDGAVTYDVAFGTPGFGGTASLAGDQLTATQAGKIKITATKAESKNYKEAQGKLDVTISQRELTVIVDCTGVSKVYNGNTELGDGKKPTVTLTGAVGEDAPKLNAVTFAYADAKAGENKTVKASNISLELDDVNYYHRNYTVSSTAEGKGAVIFQKFIEAAVDSPAKVYDGNTAVKLEAKVDSGNLEGTDSLSISGLCGTFDTAEAGTGKTVTVDSSEVVLTGTNADCYALVYPKTVKGTVTKADAPTVTAPTVKKDLVYTGQPQELLADKGSATLGALVFSLDGETYSADIPTGTDAGDYTVYYKVEETDNYAGTEPATLTVTIAKATPVITAPQAITGLVYNGEAQTLITGGTTTGGTLKYSIIEPGVFDDVFGWSEDIPAGMYAGAYSVHYMVEGNKNYEDLTSEDYYVAVTIDRQAVSDPVIASKVYNGKTLTADVPASDLYTVAQNEGGVDVGEYSVVLRLTDPGNYCWEATAEEEDRAEILEEATPVAGQFRPDAPGLYPIYPVDYGLRSLTFTVTPATLTVGPKDITITCGDPAPKLEMSFDGLAARDTIREKQYTLVLWDKDGKQVTEEYAANHPGTYVIEWSTFGDYDFAELTNYTVTKKQFATLTVKALPYVEETTKKPAYAAPKTETVTVPVVGEENTVHVLAKVEGTTATIDKINEKSLHQVIGSHVETGTVTVDFSKLDKDIDTVVLHADTVAQIAQAAHEEGNDTEALEIRLSDGVSIEFCADSLAEKVKQIQEHGEEKKSDDTDIIISIQPARKAKDLTAQQKKAAGSRTAYHVTVMSHGESLTDLGGEMIVHVPYTLKPGEKVENLTVYLINEDGTLEPCEITYDSETGLLNWKTGKLGLFVIKHEA